MKLSETYGIYRNLREVVDIKHTALVIWDVQNGFVNNSFNKEVFLNNVKSFSESARSHGILIIYTKYTPLPRKWESPWRLFMSMRRAGVDSLEKLQPFMQPGTPDSEICREVTPQPDDIVMTKHTTSLFIGTHVEAMMKNVGITTILFSGLTTEIGIMASTLDSSNRGFYSVVVEDCVTSRNKDIHETAMKVLKAGFCLVVPSAEITKEWI